MIFLNFFKKMLFLSRIFLPLNSVLFLLHHTEFLLVINGIYEILSQGCQGTNVKFNTAILDIIFSGNLIKL